MSTPWCPHEITPKSEDKKKETNDKNVAAAKTVKAKAKADLTSPDSFVFQTKAGRLNKRIRIRILSTRYGDRLSKANCNA